MKPTMLLTPLALAATAAAIVVPVISDVDDGIVQALPIETGATVSLPASAILRTVDVPCAQCEDADSHLRLDFHVDHGSRLMLNGFELYPESDPRTSDLVASVAGGDGTETEQKLGYGLSVELGAADREQQMQLIDVELQIIQVGGRFVEGIPSVKVQLIQAATGDVMIGNVVQEEASEAGCSSVLCRAKGMLAEFTQALKSLKGCAGNWLKIKGPQHLGAPQDKAGQQGTGFVPIHGSRPDGHAKGRHHGHHYNWRQLLRNIASHIFLPVLMGVTAGVAVAGVAMVLCSLVIRIARFAKSKRAHGTRCCRKKQASARQVADEEKVGLMEAVCEEQPPQYEDETPKN